MVRPLRLLLCLFVALHLAGGHWGMLQVIAWGQMLHSYSQERGLLTAVKDTFDGEHPCPMCCKIKAGQAKEQKEKPAPTSTSEKSAQWVTLLTETRAPDVSWHQEDTRLPFVFSQPSHAQWGASPPTPPPRCGVCI